MADWYNPCRTQSYLSKWSPCQGSLVGYAQDPCLYHHPVSYHISSSSSLIGQLRDSQTYLAPPVSAVWQGSIATGKQKYRFLDRQTVRETRLTPWTVSLSYYQWYKSMDQQSVRDTRLTPWTVSLSYYQWYKSMDRQSVCDMTLTLWTVSLSYYHGYEYMDRQSVRDTKLTPWTVSLSYCHWYKYMDRQSVHSTRLTPWTVSLSYCHWYKYMDISWLLTAWWGPSPLRRMKDLSLHKLYRLRLHSAIGKLSGLLSLISHRLSVVGHRPSFSMTTGCVMPLRGDWAIFCLAGSGLAQNGLAECDQLGKNQLKCSIMAGNWTLAGNWTRATGRTDSDIHSFSHWAIMTQRFKLFIITKLYGKWCRTHCLADISN